MARRIVQDWDQITRFKARTLAAGLKKSMPGQWGEHIEILALPDASVPVWLKDSAWLERLETFKAQHGGALSWAMSDHDICDKARALAGWVQELLELKTTATSDTPQLSMGGVDCSEAVKLDKVRALCDIVGVEYPVAVTALGAINRALSDVWWRRVLRRTVARVVEHAAIKLGVVNRNDGGYCSDDAVKRRGAQIKRNAEMMAGTLMRNEAGQVFTLADLAKKSTANPEIRGGELMTRIRGCEEHADASGHVGYFFTLTAPSKFHAVRMEGKKPRQTPARNPKYDGVSTPRDAQMWLRTAWARTRAECAREGVGMYGFRVAEPHHDGCPHWHALLWFTSDSEARRAMASIGKHFLSDGGPVVAVPGPGGVMQFKAGQGASHEQGSLKNRINIKRMVLGGAAGYAAKYVAKNIGHFDVGVHLDGMEVDTRDVKGWQRVDAWAATWGIRQFQAVGQPSVTVWRELRRVTKDQVETARVQGDGVAWKAWGAVQRIGDVMADWRRYMVVQGGPCLKRCAYAIATALRVNPDHVNGYGEAVAQKKVVGLSLPSGRWLISRRQAWGRVCDESAVLQEPAERAALGAPWTGFNNCTARLGGNLRAALLGLKRGMHGMETCGNYGT